MSKNIINTLFIVLVGMFLVILNEFDLLQSGAPFAIIPIMLAYFLGQFVERKFKAD